MKHARPDYDRFQDPAGLIPADEPVFLLRGQDQLAHTVVRMYAHMASQAGRPDISLAAGRHADLMQAWAKKLPDMPSAATAEETAAEERAARWNLDGRFVYRNKHGAVGYVDGPDSNPGLIAVIKVGGADAEQVAARLHAELSKPATNTDALQADLRELLMILGMRDHARAASPHEVFQEALAVLRGRLAVKPSEDPARLAQALDAAAAKAPPSRASTYRRLAAVLREPGFAGGTTAPAIRCGDIVRHKPSNETWTVAYADPVSGNLAWCGWPDGTARVTDCELVEPASNEQHRGTLREVIKAGGTRAAAAQRLYGDPDQTVQEVSRG